MKQKKTGQPAENPQKEKKATAALAVKPSPSLREQKRDARKRAKKYSAQLKQQDKKVKQSNEARINRIKRDAPPRSVQEAIKYRRMLDDGICELGGGLYSKTIKISDINYQTARRDEQASLFMRYCETLNSCGPNTHLQISAVNSRIDTDAFRENMFLPLRDDAQNEYRKEINTMLADKSLEGKNSIICEKYVTVTTAATSYHNAIGALNRLETDFASHFKAMGCETASLSGAERLRLIHGIFRPDERFDFDYRDLIYSNLTTKDAVAPTSLDFSPRDTFNFGRYTGQVLYAYKLPSDLDDELITDLSDLPINMTVTIHIDGVDQSEALNLVRRRIALIDAEKTDVAKKAWQQNLDPELLLPAETRHSAEEAEELLKDLRDRNQRMFRVSFTIYTYAEDRETLDSNVYQIKTIARQHGVYMDSIDYRQLEAINSVLPIGRNYLNLRRTLTTASTAIFVPFTTQELYQKGGIYYGLNALSRNLVFFDRRSLKSPNGVILGSPGSGKSFSAKREMISVLLSDPNAEVIIIDPEREYTSLANGLGDDAAVVRVAAGSRNHLNPMDISMDYADDDNPLTLKSDFIMSMCDLIIGGSGGLTGAEMSIIGRACNLTYQPYFANPNKNPMPTLRDFWQILKKMPEPEAQKLALSLEIYIDGTLSVFSHPTNVDVQKRLVVYDIRDLGKQLRTLGMLIVLDQIWNRVTQNREKGRRTWIYVDEFQLLTSNDFCRNYFFELWSRARKWGAVPTGITQNVETLLLNDDCRRMLSTSDFIMMFNQAPSDRIELAGLLNMSDKQLSYVTNSDAGHGLLTAGKSIVPFVDSFPTDTELYRMMTTKLEEVTANGIKNAAN